MPTVLTREEREQVVADLENRILEWTEQLCESLAENYKRYHKRMITANSNYFEGELSKYAKDQLAALDSIILL